MFFGLDWFSAFMKVSFEVVFAIVTAIPFYYAWNVVAPVYFDFLPDIWKVLPYWHIVFLFLSFTYIGQNLNKLVPKIISVSQSNDNKG